MHRWTDSTLGSLWWRASFPLPVGTAQGVEGHDLAWATGAFTRMLFPGYYGEGLNAIIVFAACFLPDSSSPDYHYIMENLFL